MKRNSTSKTDLSYLLPLTAAALLAAASANAQVPVDDNGKPLASIDAGSSIPEDGAYQDFDIEAVEQLTPAELQELIGPVALYPDDLLAIVLPASTYPLEIVQAARFLENLKTDSSLKPDEDWDESVTALLNYPEVIDLMNADIDWTWKLGEAVVRQQQDVIAAVEDFRDRAYAAGNLKTDERQTVSHDEGIIEIVPIDEEIIYVPYYEPEHVLVTQVQPVYHYYPRAYPVYYYPYPYGYSFGSGYFWGVTTAFRIGWATDYLRVHHHSYWGHPYYGRRYYGNYYRRPNINVYNSYYVNNRVRYSANHYRDGDYWRPRTYGGARPGQHRSRTHSYRTTDIARNATVRTTSVRRDGRGSGGTRNRTSSRGTADSEITFRNRDRESDRSRTTSNRSGGSTIVANNRNTNQRGSSNRGEITFRSRDRERDSNNRAAGRPGSTRPTTVSSRPLTTPTTRSSQRAADRREVSNVTRPSVQRNTIARPSTGSNRSTPANNRVQRQAAPRNENRASPTPAREARPATRRSDSSSNRSGRSERTTGTGSRANSRDSSRGRRQH